MKNKKGFSIVGVLLGLFLVVFFSTIIFELLNNNQAQTQKTSNRFKPQIVADNIVNALTSLDANSLLNLVSVSAFNTNTWNNVSATNLSTNTNFTWISEQVDGVAITQIEMGIQFFQGNGQTALSTKPTDIAAIMASDRLFEVRVSYKRAPTGPIETLTLNQRILRE